MNEKMRLLFIDDRSKRMMNALKKYGDTYEVVLASNVKESLRLLSEEEWDVVSMDHDLNGGDYLSPHSEDTGMEIIRYIEKTGWPHKNKPKIIIHSANAFAAVVMWTHMKDLGFLAVIKRYEYV